jgi:hypothetical protein
MIAGNLHDDEKQKYRITAKELTHILASANWARDDFRQLRESIS